MRLGCLMLALLAAAAASSSEPAVPAAPVAASSPAPPVAAAPSPAPAASSSSAAAGGLPGAEATELSPVGEQPPRAQEKADAASDRAYLIELRRPARATAGRTHVQLHLVPPSVALLRPPRAPSATLVSAVLRPMVPAVSSVPAAAAAAGALAMLDGGSLEAQAHGVRAPTSELHWRSPYHFPVHKPFSFGPAGAASAFTPAFASPTPAYAAQPPVQLAAQIPAPAPAPAAAAVGAAPASHGAEFRFPQLPQPAPAPAPAQPHAYRWEETHFNKDYFSPQEVRTESSLYSSASQATPFYATAAGAAAGAGGRYLSSSPRPGVGYFARPTAAVPPPLAFHPQPAASAPAPAYQHPHHHFQHPQPQPQPQAQHYYQQPLQSVATAPAPQYVPRPAAQASELAPQTRPAPAAASAPAPPPPPPPPPTAPASTAAPPEPARSRATLRQVLQDDCPDAERLGFCASPPRYPSHQVSLAIHRCRDLLSHLYVPVPESASQTTRPHSGMERANREVWSWARNATAPGAGGAGGNGVCASESARVLPGYARDALGRWLVVVQAAGLVVQPAHVDVCRAPGLPCPALAKCSQVGGALAGGAGGRRGLKAAKASTCEQRFTPHHVVTWDPDAPERCPKLSVVLLPTACTCRLPSDS